ncbi:MAG: tetratricopeptide repeat protein [Spirochaetes bacterium]|nr:tetratricopeptide repeat protein [Spirochaetota bacterium]
MKRAFLFAVAFSLIAVTVSGQSVSKRLADIHERAAAAYDGGDWESTIAITLEMDALGIRYETVHKPSKDGSTTAEEDAWSDCLWMRACAYRELGRYDESLAAFAILRKCYPGWADAYIETAYTMRSKGDAGGADRLLRAAVPKVPETDRFRLYWNLAWFGYEDGNWADSTANAAKSAELEPRAAGPRFVAALSCFARKDDREGMRWFFAGYDAAILEPEQNEGIVEAFDSDLVDFLDAKPPTPGAWTAVWFCRYALGSDADSALILQHADTAVTAGALARGGRMLAGTLEAFHDLYEAKGDTSKLRIVESVWAWRVDTIGEDKDLLLAWLAVGKQATDQGKYDAAIAVLEPLKDAVLLLFGPDTLPASAAFNKLGAACYDSGDYAGAKTCFEGEVAACVAFYGANARNTAIAWYNLGNARREGGDTEGALDAYGKGLAAATASTWRNGREGGFCLYGMGQACLAAKDYKRAIRYLSEAAPILAQTAATGDETPILAWIELGKACNQDGDYTRAADAFDEALRLTLAAYGPDSLEAGTCRVMAGIACNNAKEWQRAAVHLEKAVAIRRELKGLKSVLTAEAMAEAGRAYTGLRDFAKALPYLEQALAIRIETLGPDHGDVANSLLDLGRAYKEAGIADKAVDVLGRAVAAFRKLGPGYELPAASAANDLGLVLSDTGDWDPALARFEEALATYRKTLGEGSNEVADIYGNIGSMYAAKGDYRMAASYYRKTVDLLVAAYGPDDPRLVIPCSILGDAYRSIAAFDDAISYYRKALAAAEKGEGPGSRTAATMCNNIAVVLSDKGDCDAALAYYGRAKAIFEKISGPDHPDMALCYDNIGTVLSAKGDFEGAAASMEKALAIRIKAYGREHPTVSHTLSNLGITQIDLGNYEKGIALLEEALALRIRVSGAGHPDTVAVWNNLGVARSRQGDYKRGVECFETALAITAKASGTEHPDYAVTLNNLGYVFQDRGDWLRALDCYERALAIMAKVLGPEHESVAVCWNNLGSLHADRGDFDLAIEEFDRSLAITLSHFGPKHPSAARCYSNLGTVYVGRKEFDRGIEYFDKACEIFIDLLGPDHESVGIVYNNIGAALIRKRAWNDAIRYFDLAISIHAAKFGPADRNVAPTLTNLGRAYAGKGDRAKAVECFERSTAIIAAAFGPGHLSIASNYSFLGASAGNAGDLAQAETWYRKAFDLAEASASRKDMADYAAELGMVRLGLGRFADAQKAFDSGAAAVETARREMGTTRTSFVARNLGIYHLSIQAAVKLGDLAGAFASAESLRARGFLDRLSLKAALESEGIVPADRDRMLELSERVEFSASRLSRELEKPESKQDRALISSLGKDKKAFEVEMGGIEGRLFRLDRYRELRSPRVATLADAQRLCPPDAAILEYVIWEEKDPESPDFARKRSWCIVVTREGASIAELDRDFDWSGTVKAFRDAVFADEDRTAVARLSASLYRTLIAPVESRIAGKKALVIVPDGPLAFLPFDALRASDLSPWLCQSYDLSLAPSVSVLASSLSGTATPRSGLLAFGSALYGTLPAAADGPAGTASTTSADYYRRTNPNGWEELPGTWYEIEALRNSVFGPAASTVKTNADASERELKALSASGKLGKFGVVHFAVHGFFDAENPEFSAVVLSESSGGTPGSAEDGYLSVEEAALLKLDADLLTLSACETGLGKEVRGDGVVGLTRAFMTAGADRALVTLWKVDDAATRDFMVAAYSRMVKDGKSVKRAIAETKRDFAASKGRASPYWWAAFTLYGF